MIKIKKFVVGYLGTNCYFLIGENNDCFVVDPGAQFDVLKDKIIENGLNVKGVILTHAHFDHMLALEEMRDFFGSPLYIHQLDNESLPDPEKTLMKKYSGCKEGIREAEHLLNDGDKITLGEDEITIIHTPGHTKGSICLLFGDNMISGDTLFKEGIGRYDFYGGDYSLLCKSLKRLSEMEINYKVYPGHGPATELSYEKTHNIALL